MLREATGFGQDKNERKSVAHRVGHQVGKISSKEIPNHLRFTISHIFTRVRHNRKNRIIPTYTNIKK